MRDKDSWGTRMQKHNYLEADYWWPLELSRQEVSAIEDFGAQMLATEIPLDKPLLGHVSRLLTDILSDNIDHLIGRDSLPVLSHIINGWGNAIFHGEEIYEYFINFLHRDNEGHCFLLQCDPEGDFHPWQSLAYVVMAGIDPQKTLSNGSTLETIAEHSRYINVGSGTELGHLLFALAYLLRTNDERGDLFLLKGEPYDLARLLQLARDAHYEGDFEVCRKFHLTEGLCAVASRVAGFSEYRDEAAYFLKGQLQMLQLVGVILDEATRSLQSMKGIDRDSVANPLRESLFLGPMLENHCFYAGHIIELAAFSVLLGYEISHAHRNTITYVINTLNRILLLYLPLADFKESFLHFGHYRRAITLWNELPGANFGNIADVRAILAKYTADFDHKSARALDRRAKFCGAMEPRDDVFKVETAQAQIRGFFSQVVRYYDGLASQHFRSQGRGDHYRRARPLWWPRSIHYELLDYGSDVGAEIHLESKAVAPVGTVLYQLMSAHDRAFAPNQINWDPNWYQGMGRMRVLFHGDQSPEIIAHGMSKLIQLTFEPVDEAVRGLTISPPDCFIRL
jgi:hypothetical protein